MKRFHNNLPATLCLLILSSTLLGADTVLIDESTVFKFAKSATPGRQMIEAGLLQASQAQAQFSERFNTSLVTKADYASSQERALAPFIPVFDPQMQFSVGLQRPLSLGAVASVEAFSSQQSTADGFFDRATRSGLRAGLALDLWKNIAGRLDHAQEKSLSIAAEKAQLQSKVDSRIYELSLLKVYWSLVANDVSLQIARRLLKTSRQQLQQAKKRLQASISDKGVVARYQAQVASRQAQVAGMQYQRGNLIETLQNQLPQLAGKEVTLAKLSIEDKVAEVLQCSATIATQTTTPWDYTYYDDMIGLLERQYEYDRTLADAHSSVDLQLQSQLQVSGVDRGFGNSFGNLQDAGQSGYQVGLQLTIALGDEPRKTEEIKAKLIQKQSQSQRQNLRLSVAAKHQQISKTIGYLFDSLKAQKANSESLSTSAKEMERKFRQARVSEFDLIGEQDALQSSLLGEVETQLATIQVLYEYFQIFTEFPCSTNFRGEKS